MAKSKYDGITEEKNSKGEVQIYVVFQYMGVRYSKKNFTKLFGCKTIPQAYKILEEVKVDLRNNKDPFEAQRVTLDHYFKSMVSLKVKNGYWKEQTMLLNTRFYNKYLKEKLGHKAPHRITAEDLLKVLGSDEMKHLHDHTKAKMKDILKPIFKSEIRKGNLRYSPLEDLPKFEKQAIKEDISFRSLDGIDVIAKKIYKAIPYLYSYKKDEIHNFLYLNLMTGHRVGELRKLDIKYIDIERKTCVSPASITKTKVPYKFPIPDEVIPYLKTIEKGKVFPTLSKSIDSIYRRLVKVADIHLVDEKNVTAHDTRRFILYVMVNKLKIDGMLADSCLNHKGKSQVIDHYWSAQYEDIEEAFFKYWEFLRDSEFKFTPVLEGRRARRSKKEIAKLREKGLMKPKYVKKQYPTKPLEEQLGII